jgi:hypothetical protein
MSHCSTASATVHLPLALAMQCMRIPRCKRMLDCLLGACTQGKSGTWHGTWHQLDTSLQPIRAAAGATCLFHVGSSMQATCSKQLRYGQGCSPACICRVLVTDRQGRADPPLLPPTSSGHLCGPGLPSCQQLRLSSSDAPPQLDCGLGSIKYPVQQLVTCNCLT